MALVAFLNHGLLTSSLTLITAAFAGGHGLWPLCWRSPRRVQRMSILVICGDDHYICSAVTEFLLWWPCPGQQHRQPPQLVSGLPGMTSNVQATGMVVLPALAAAFTFKPMAAYQMGGPRPERGHQCQSLPVAGAAFSSLLAACVTALRGPSPLGIAVPHRSSSCSAAQSRWWSCPVLPGRAAFVIAAAFYRLACLPPLSDQRRNGSVWRLWVVIWLLVRRVRRGCAMKYRCETKELAIGYGGAPLPASRWGGAGADPTIGQRRG